MIVMCEGCETNFQVEDSVIRSTGSKVRCSKCRHIFTAYSPAALAAAEEPLVLDEALPEDSPTKADSELPEIESQFDTLFADNFGVAAEAPTDEEPEQLDVEDLLSDDAIPASALASGGTDDDLKLDLDLDLDFDAETEAKKPSDDTTILPALDDLDAETLAQDAEPALNAAASDTLASLDELGISLESMEGIGDENLPSAADAKTPNGTETLGLDLDLEIDLNALVAETADDASLEALAAEPETAAAGETADIIAEEELAGVPEEAKPLSEGELDLSDLEAMLDGSSQRAAPQAASTVVLDLELDEDGAAVDRSAQGADLEELDLSGIASEPAESSTAVDAVTELPEEIDLALDVEDGPTPVPDSEAMNASHDDELDFSDITNVLEEPLTASGKEITDTASELDLMLGESQPQDAPAVSAPQIELQEGLLLDLESLLEQDDASETPPPSESGPATEELDLDMALRPEPVVSDDLEIEVESATDTNAYEASAGQDYAADAVNNVKDAATDSIAAEAIAVTGNDGVTDAFDMQTAAMAAETPRHSSLRRYLVTAAGAIVLLGAAVFVPRNFDIQVPFLSDIEVPFLGKVFQSHPEDVAGNLKMAPIAEKLSAEFLDHPGAGRLCVVRGEIRNNYDHSRSAIRVAVKLFKNDKTLAKSATIYAGNLLANQDLLAKDLAAITAQLKNKEGVNSQNMDIKPGRSVAFMAVFDSIPDNLDEYSVEVAGSTK